MRSYLIKNDVKYFPRASKSLPNLSEKLPKTLPKPFQNPFKDVIEKNILLGLDFFTFFHNFDLKNHQFFIGCLLRSGIQISLIFGALSPSQSIVVWLVFRRLWASSAKNEILWKYAFPLGKITIFKVSSITENSKFSKQMMKQHIEKQWKFHMFFAIVFMKNPRNFYQKWGLQKHTPKMS